MSREIIYRAWDAKNKEMIHEIGIILERDRYLHDVFQDENLTFMQYTGLKDKNGTKIFEGDVVKIDGDKSYEDCDPKPDKGEYIGIFIVGTELTLWGYQTSWKHISGYQCTTHIIGENDNGITNTLEILGNIYEHPSLLPTNNPNE